MTDIGLLTNQLNAYLKRVEIQGDPPTANEQLQNQTDLNETMLKLVSELSSANTALRAVSELQQRAIRYLNLQAWSLKKTLFHGNDDFETECFNGQFSKQRIWNELHRIVPFGALVETGSYLGGTTEFLARTGLPVFSIELSPDFHRLAAARVAPYENAVIANGSSGTILPQFLGDRPQIKHLFLYLDAHWYSHLPLREELHAIFSGRDGDVVMIDDFEVKGDEGFAFDRYENDALNLDYIRDIITDYDLKVFFPVMRSEQDHCLIDIVPPRGTILLCKDPSIRRLLQSAKSLREYRL